jgi:hypothetical protein
MPTVGVSKSLTLFRGRVFWCATAYPKAQGIWRDDERGGALVKDEPVVVHRYTTPDDIENPGRLSELGRSAGGCAAEPAKWRWAW